MPVNPDKYFMGLFDRTEAYANSVRQVYAAAIEELTAIALAHKDAPGKTFSFSDSPVMQSKATAVLRAMYSRVYAEIQGGVKAEWDIANIQNDKLLKAIFGPNAMEKSHLAKYFNQNQGAMDAFINRAKQEGGLNLSQKVWKYVGQFKDEMESALDLGIGEGGSAGQISRAVRSYLQNPDKLFRRVQETIKDAEGNITKTGKYRLSKAAKAYHPGQGVYRSSYKNSMRLTRTETNMAYHTSNYDRWQQMDFVVGYEVKLSKNHPDPDICNDLAGRYPKTFKFVGWHPQCRCYVVAILATKEEMALLQDKLLNGEEITSFESVNQVSKMPDGYNSWIDKNKERVLTARSLPYFIKDNYVSKDITQGLKFRTASFMPNQITNGNIPLELRAGSDYLKGSKVEFDNRFFNLFDPSKPVTLRIDKSNKGSHYSSGFKQVVIANDSRAANSEWFRKSVIYHEYGHALDYQRRLKETKEVADLMQKWKKELSKRTPMKVYLKDWTTNEYSGKILLTPKIGQISFRLEQLNNKINRMDNSVFLKRGITKYDVKEQILSVQDTIKAININYGCGHPTAYFKHLGMKETEFLAHAFENTFASNTVFKKYLPDLYDEMIDYVNRLK